MGRLTFRLYDKTPSNDGHADNVTWTDDGCEVDAGRRLRRCYYLLVTAPEQDSVNTNHSWQLSTSWSIVLLVKRLNASKTAGIIIRPLNSIERPKLCSWFEIGLKGWRWCWDTDSWFPTTRPISILIIWLFPFWKGYEETCGWEWNAGNMITTNHWSVSIN